MSDVYGESDVKFGDDRLPNWREYLEEAEDPDDEELDETPPDVVAMLGFDPKEKLEGE